MVYSVFTDRLGNNLFQFAAAFSIDKDVIICVPNKREYKYILQYSELFFKGIEIIDFVPDEEMVYCDPAYTYTKIKHKVENKLVLRGYFQSYKYIDKTLIRKQFRLDKSIALDLKERYPRLLSQKFSAIHVRRGDYMKNLYKHPFCGKRYYREAIKELGNPDRIIIFSDDIKWCRNNLRGENIDYMEGSSFLDDFFLMTFAEQLVISNSSFSYWAAFLNEKKSKVIVPSLWYGFRHKVDTRDLIPKGWQVINNHYSLFLLIRAVIQFISHHLRHRFGTLKARLLR